VLDEDHLLHLCRYIHANPVIHGIVDDVADWPYSNYLEWTGERPGTLVDRDLITAHFRNADAYRDFVADYARHCLPAGLDYLKEW